MQAPLALGQPAGFRWPPSWHLLVRRPWAGHLTRLRRVSKKIEAARRGRCGLKTTSVRCVCTPMCPQASVALCSRRGTDCVLAGQLQSVASGQCVSVRPAKPRSRRPIPPADGLSPPCPRLSPERRGRQCFMSAPWRNHAPPDLRMSRKGELVLPKKQKAPGVKYLKLILYYLKKILASSNC